MLFLKSFFAEYTRCGGGFKQCMATSSLCDGFIDCVTGFDESKTACGYFEESMKKPNVLALINALVKS